MQALRIDERTLLVPMRAEADDGTIGHALVELTREDDPELYDQWAGEIDGTA